MNHLPLPTTHSLTPVWPPLPLLSSPSFQYCARKDFLLEWISTGRKRGGASMGMDPWPRPSYLGPTSQPYVFEAPEEREDVRGMRLREEAQGKGKCWHSRG